MHVIHKIDEFNTEGHHLYIKITLTYFKYRKKEAIPSLLSL